MKETAKELIKSENIQNKVFGYLEQLFPYIGLEKKALDMYLQEIEKSNLSPDAKLIAVLNSKQTIKGLKNQGKIIQIAAKTISTETDPRLKPGYNEEWFERFLDSAKHVSSEEMQAAWGRILAKEIDNPGTTPPNLIRILSEFTPKLARIFRALCSMKILLIVMDGEKIAEALWYNCVYFDQNNDLMAKYGIDFAVLNELESLGVIKFAANQGFCLSGFSYPKVLIYVDGKTIDIVKYKEDELPAGNVMFTAAGDALKAITDTLEIPDYDLAAKNHLKKYNVVIADRNEYCVSLYGDKVMVTRIANCAVRKVTDILKLYPVDTSFKSSSQFFSINVGVVVFEPSAFHVKHTAILGIQIMHDITVCMK